MPTQTQITPARNIALWVVQSLLAVLFIGTAIFKLFSPVAAVAAEWPWAGEYPILLRLTGVVDLLGGVGIILPTVTRIKPWLAGWAGLGCADLMVFAIVFHVMRDEILSVPFNFAVLALSLFVFLGRRKG